MKKFIYSKTEQAAVRKAKKLLQDRNQSVNEWFRLSPETTCEVDSSDWLYIAKQEGIL